MKISKLFHWLYGALMLLPILVFIPNAFYYGFNETAQAQEKTEQVPIYYESNEVNNSNDIYIGKIYNWTNNFTSDYSGTTKEVFRIDVDLFKVFYPSLVNVDINYVSLRLNTNGSFGYSYQYNGSQYEYGNMSLKQISFIPLTKSNTDIIDDYLINYITYSDMDYIKEYTPVTTSMSITDSMSYAWDSVWQNDLFSWSYDSFLTTPFQYIGGVFGIPNDNTLYYCLSYWLDISIIWLCFDLVMYVPLLVHRWLDKGVLE